MFFKPDKIEKLWCGTEVTVGYDEHLHPFHYHKTVSDTFKDGVRTITEACEPEKVYRVVVKNYTLIN